MWSGLCGKFSPLEFSSNIRSQVRKTPTVISLYSGAGGIDYGLEAAGFETRVATDLDGDCCRTLRLNRPWAVLEGSITEIPSSRLLAAAGLSRGEASLLVGGPPCQPFSKSGYWARGDSLRLKDPRAVTLTEYFRVLEDTLPQAFLLENVEGMAYNKKSEAVDVILSLLDGINQRQGTSYTIRFSVLSAADYGVPQLRSRFLMVGSREGMTFRFPEPTHRSPDSVCSEESLPLHRTAWDALADIGPAPGESLRMRGKWADLLPSIPEGLNYLHHTNRGAGEPLFGWRRRYWSFLLKLAKARPSWTIQAQPGPAIGPFHWSSRLLSARELCRLQTFPDDVQITGGRGAVQRQVGNAVPSLLAEVIGREIAEQILGATPSASPLRLMPPDRGRPPEPEPVAPVPEKYLALIGEHEDHPGTGLGYRAQARLSTPLAEGSDEYSLFPDSVHEARDLASRTA